MLMGSGSYYLIESMLVVLLMTAVLIVLLIAGGENVTIKSRSIAIGMTTGTIGSTARKERYTCSLMPAYFTGKSFKEFPESGVGLYLHHKTQCQQRIRVSGLIYLHQQMNETAIMYLVVMWKNTMTTFWNMSTASAPIHIHVTSVK